MSEELKRFSERLSDFEVAREKLDAAKDRQSLAERGLVGDRKIEEAHEKAVELVRQALALFAQTSNILREQFERRAELIAEHGDEVKRTEEALKTELRDMQLGLDNWRKMERHQRDANDRHAGDVQSTLDDLGSRARATTRDTAPAAPPEPPEPESGENESDPDDGSRHG